MPYHSGFMQGDYSILRPSPWKKKKPPHFKFETAILVFSKLKFDYFLAGAALFALYLISGVPSFLVGPAGAGFAASLLAL